LEITPENGEVLDIFPGEEAVMEILRGVEVVLEIRGEGTVVKVPQGEEAGFQAEVVVIEGVIRGIPEGVVVMEQTLTSLTISLQ